jgi:hypothetical protein
MAEAQKIGGQVRVLTLRGESGQKAACTLCCLELTHDLGPNVAMKMGRGLEKPDLLWKATRVPKQSDGDAIEVAGKGGTLCQRRAPKMVVPDVREPLGVQARLSVTGLKEQVCEKPLQVLQVDVWYRIGAKDRVRVRRWAMVLKVG